MNKKYILMLDLETTGNNRDLDTIVEVGLVLLNGDTGDEVDRLNVIVQPDGDGMARIMANDVVREMHNRSGLLDDLNNAKGITVEAADAFIVNWLDKYLKGDTEHIAYGGSGVSHFDRPYIIKYLPKFNARISHWAYDVSIMRRFFLFAGVPPMKMNGKTHRAIDDAVVHAEEFRGYVSLIHNRLGMKPTPF